MGKIFIIFIFLVLYKLITNYIKLKNIEKHKQKYLEWLGDQNSHPNIYQDGLAVRELILSAGVEEPYVFTSIPSGPGLISTGKVSVLNNYPSSLIQHTYAMMKAMDSASGVFKRRCKETVNPLFWIDFILYLPKYAISYVGLDANSVTAKVLQIFWWFLFPLTLFFREEVYRLISQHINFF